MDVNKYTKANCSRCGGDRNCDIRGEHVEQHNDDDFSSTITWRILECRGCENVFVQKISINSEEYYEYYDSDGSIAYDNIETIRYWPSLSRRKKPEWMSEAGIGAPDTDDLDAVLIELYGSLDNDLRMLAAIGIRTAYERASDLLKIEQSLTFAEKLDALVAGNHIGSRDKDRIQTMVDAGSASAHRGWRPKPEELMVMMDILEHFIYDAFVAPARRKQLDEGAAKVRGIVPPRPSKASKSKSNQI